LNKDLLEKIDHVQDECDKQLLRCKREIEQQHVATKQVDVTEVVINEALSRDTQIFADSVLVEVDSLLNALHAKVMTSVDEAFQQAHHHTKDLHVSCIDFKKCIKKSFTGLQDCLDTPEKFNHDAVVCSVSKEMHCQLGKQISVIQPDLHQIKHAVDWGLPLYENGKHVQHRCCRDAEHVHASEDINLTGIGLNSDVNALCPYGACYSIQTGFDLQSDCL